MNTDCIWDILKRQNRKDRLLIQCSAEKEEEVKCIFYKMGNIRVRESSRIYWALLLIYWLVVLHAWSSWNQQGSGVQEGDLG